FRASIRSLPIGDALRSLKDRGVLIAGAIVQSEGAIPAPLAPLSGSVAIVIGNEGAGLSRTALSMLDQRVHIPCRIESLNAAIAGSLLLYEAQRQEAERPHSQDREVVPA
ncbi:MAG TPA: TrmH family RNA methyltransferase, partial [Acidobacteriaceae bacterium]|nr:TrmH family RNA methyltransferase [Acidobacteriaceae bacterium]